MSILEPETKPRKEKAGKGRKKVLLPIGGSGGGKKKKREKSNVPLRHSLTQKKSNETMKNRI